jgi:hypothetical protein
MWLGLRKDPPSANCVFRSRVPRSAYSCTLAVLVSAFTLDLIKLSFLHLLTTKTPICFSFTTSLIMKGRPDSTQAPIPVEYEYDDYMRNAEAPPPYTVEELTGSIPQPGDTGVTSKCRY